MLERSRPRTPSLRPLVLTGALSSLLAAACGGDPGDVQNELGFEEMEGAGGAGPSATSTPMPTPVEADPMETSVNPNPPTPSVQPPSSEGPTPSEEPSPVEAPSPGVDPIPGEPVPTAEPEPTTVEPTPADPGPGPTTGVELEGVCHPLCADASTDPDGDDWGWEDEASCVVPGTATALGGTPCGSDAPAVPEPAEPPGDGYLVEGECRAECSSATTDPDGDGWGWENEATCVVADSAAAEGLERCGGAEPVPEPTTPDEPGPTTPGDTTKPDYVSSSGFYVLDGRLYDKNGNDFVIRGVNHGHYWFRTEMTTAFSAIANTGANSIRIVWETGGTAAEMRSALQASVDLEMVPMIELHDVTGDESNASLLDMARYYSGNEVKQVLIEFEESLLVNIANEWSGDDWLGGYEAAINELRNAGINHTLVVDANGWGQQADTILNNGQALLDIDPQHNLLFSTHMYQSFGTESAITAALQGAVDRQLPLIVGEFGFQHGTPPTQIPFETILSECARLGLGYMPWSWKGNNSEVAYLDMSSDWAGNTLTPWGADVIEGENGISATSQRASIFLLDM